MFTNFCLLTYTVSLVVLSQYYFINCLVRRLQLSVPFAAVATNLIGSELHSRGVDVVSAIAADDKLLPCIESLFDTIVIVLTDREKTGKWTKAEHVRSLLIHRLMVSPCTYSQLVKNLDSGAVGSSDDDD